MNTGFRIQDADRDVNDLLDPEQQFSYHYSGDDELTRTGVSVCDSIEDLAFYITQTGIEIDAHNSVIVELKGYASDDEAVDASLGEWLMLPDEVVAVHSTDGLFALIDSLLEGTL